VKAIRSKVIRLRARGLNEADIARQCHVSRQAVSQMLKRWLDGRTQRARKHPAEESRKS
jgi:predicted transcriptional regulator